MVSFPEIFEDDTYGLFLRLQLNTHEAFVQISFFQDHLKIYVQQRFQCL